MLKESGVDLTVVVPAYNEEKRLPKMLNETIAYLDARCHSKNKMKHSNTYDNIYNDSNNNNFTYEIIIVDDGSVDGTTDCALKYSAKYGDNKIRVITLEKNRGKGGAVREGVLAAKGKYVLFADADGASKFEDIAKLEEFMAQNKQSDLVIAIGSRAHMEEDAIANRSLFRTILMKGFHLLVWICCVRTVRDTQCGFKMFNRNASNLLFTNYHNESWAFDVELLYLAEQTGCTIGEIPINWEEIEGSKIVPVFSWIRMGWDVLCLATLYTIGYYRVPDRLLMNKTK